MTQANTEQVGGSHYLKRKLQPLEITYQNYGLLGLEAVVCCKVNKYLRDKEGLEKKWEDVRKAQHILRIFEDKILEEMQAAKKKESMERNR